MSKEFMQRVILERQELEDKLLKLSEFTCSAKFMELPILERERLNTQKHLMTMYVGVLSDRILHFGAK